MVNSDKEKKNAGKKIKICFIYITVNEVNLWENEGI